MKVRERIWLGVLLAVLVLLVFAAYIVRLNERQRDFIYAVGRGNIAEMERLHERGARLHASWWHGLSPVHYAISNDKPEALQWLIDHGAPLDEREYMALRPAEWALRRGRPVCFRILDEAGAPFDSVMVGDIPSMQAALRTSRYALQRVIDEGGDPNGLNYFGEPLIFSAISMGDDTIDFLLDAGADINASDLDGNTLLHASLLRSPDGATILVPQFLDLGADPTIENNVGDTALEVYISACSLQGRMPDIGIIEILELKTSDAPSN